MLTNKSPKQKRRGTPGAFGSCHNTPEKHAGNLGVRLNRLRDQLKKMTELKLPEGGCTITQGLIDPDFAEKAV